MQTQLCNMNSNPKEGEPPCSPGAGKTFFSGRSHRKLRLLGYTVALLLCSFATNAYAQKASVDVSMEPKRGFVGEPIHVTINLSLNGSLQGVEVPTLDGFDVVAGQWPPRAPQVFISGGFFQVPLADVYLAATRPGTLTFGKVKITVGGNVIESAPIAFEALARPEASASMPASQGVTDRYNDPLYGLPQTPTDSLVLHAVADRDVAYVGGVTVISYWLLVRPGVRLSNLSIDQPDIKGALVRPMLDSNQEFEKKDVNWGGNPYGAYLINRIAVIPLDTNPLTIGALKISVLAGGVFGQPVERPSESVSLEIKPLPEGKPQADQTVIGRYTMSLTTSAPEATVGEAFPVSLVVSGQGDLSSFEPPTFSDVKGARARTPAVKRDDGIDQQKSVLSRVEAQYFFVPEKAGELTLQAPTLAALDPETGTWSTITAPPLVVKVTGENTGGGAILLGLRASREELSGPSALSFGVGRLLLFVAIPLVSFVGLLLFDTSWRRRRGEKAPFVPAHQELAKAEKIAAAGDFYRALSNVVVLGAEAVLQKPMKGKTWKELSEALSSVVGNERAEKTRAFLERADQARFAPGGSSSEEKKKSLEEVKGLLSLLEASTRRPT